MTSVGDDRERSTRKGGAQEVEYKLVEELKEDSEK